MSAAGPDDGERAALRAELLEQVDRLERSGGDVRDLSVAVRAMGELATAARVFSPWHDRPKVTIFGSARVSETAPQYALARDVAARLAARGWMVVSGAGPGIMEAAARGAGEEATLGVNIELPFERGANRYVEADTRLVEMKYFFTRKVALTRESAAFVFFPGGVGTMDDLFELLALLHTGKTSPAPIVLADVDGGRYWESWLDFVTGSIIEAGYLDDAARDLVRVCHDAAAIELEVVTFFSNYRGFTHHDGHGRMDLVTAPDEATRTRIAEVLAGVSGPGEVSVDGGTLNFPFDGRHYAELRRVIDLVNRAAGPPPR